MLSFNNPPNLTFMKILIWIKKAHSYLLLPGWRWLPDPWTFCWPALPARKAARTECWSRSSQRWRPQPSPAPAADRCWLPTSSRRVCWGYPRCWTASAACWSSPAAATGPAEPAYAPRPLTVAQTLPSCLYWRSSQSRRYRCSRGGNSWLFHSNGKFKTSTRVFTRARGSGRPPLKFSALSPKLQT